MYVIFFKKIWHTFPNSAGFVWQTGDFPEDCGIVYFLISDKTACSLCSVFHSKITRFSISGNKNTKGVTQPDEDIFTYSIEERSAFVKDFLEELGVNRYITCEQHHKKTCLWGVQPGLTQTWLYSHIIWLETCRKKRDYTIYVAKMKVLISCTVAMQLMVTE